MGVVKQINDDLNRAQKEKNETVVGTLRVLRAEFMNAAIAKLKKELTDEEALEVIKSQAKKLREVLSDFERGGRADLVEKNKKEIAILNKYLPAALSEGEIKKEIEEVVRQGGYKAADFGKAMSAAMVKLKGRAEGGEVSRILKEMLPK